MKDLIDRFYVVSLMISRIEAEDSGITPILEQRLEELELELLREYEEMNLEEFAALFREIDPGKPAQNQDTTGKEGCP